MNMRARDPGVAPVIGMLKRNAEHGDHKTCGRPRHARQESQEQ
jgi:hypothetical protein